MSVSSIDIRRVFMADNRCSSCSTFAIYRDIQRVKLPFSCVLQVAFFLVVALRIQIGDY